MATCASEDSSSLPKPTGGGNSDHSACTVRCFVHNIADDTVDAEPTIRSLLEPHVSVRHCQLSIAGLSRISRPTLTTLSVVLYPPIRPLQPSQISCLHVKPYECTNAFHGLSTSRISRQRDSFVRNKFVRPRWPYVMRHSVCHCNSLGGAK